MIDDSPSLDDLLDEVIRTFKTLAAFKAYGPRIPGAEPGSYGILFHLRDQPKRVSDLADALPVDVTVVSRQGTMLAAAGLVAKSPDPHDGRAQLLSLTDDGRTFTDALMRHRRELFDLVLDGWSPDEIADLTHHLRRLRDALDRTRTVLTASPDFKE